MTQIIARSEWGARFGRGTADPGPEARVVIHHSYKPALTATASAATEASAWQAIERYHVEVNEWGGIGYNFGVAPSGRIYEGRGWRFRGAHAGPVNGESIGICLLIDGNTTEPPPAMIAAVRSLIRMGLAQGEIAEGYTLSGHRDHMDRACPGEKVYRRLQELRHDAGLAELREVEPGVVRPAPAPPALDLERIVVPHPVHVEEIVRVRGLKPEAVRAGLEVAEVLLRGVIRGQIPERRDVLLPVANAAADWIKAHR